MISSIFVCRIDKADNNATRNILIFFVRIDNLIIKSEVFELAKFTYFKIKIKIKIKRSILFY
jgi:hypothetical protein